MLDEEMTQVDLSPEDLDEIMERREELEIEFDLERTLVFFLNCQNRIEDLNAQFSQSFKNMDLNQMKRLIALMKYEISLKEAAEDKVLSLGGSF